MTKRSPTRRTLVALALLALTTTGVPSKAQEGAGPSRPAEAAASNQDQVLALLKDMDSKNAQELRQIKREIVALGQKMEEPGLREIMGGIGYIVGLCGVAAYVAARRKDRGH